MEVYCSAKLQIIKERDDLKSCLENLRVFKTCIDWGREKSINQFNQNIIRGDVCVR